MLNVYTYRIPKPRGAIDLSMIPLDQLTDDAIAIFEHQTDIHIWFGYLDGWMLNPREEVILRRLIRKFECSVVTAFPLALSQSWKNETRTVYTARPHGYSDTDNNGSLIHDGGSIGYGGIGS